MNICATRWANDDEPCTLGSTTEHVCYNTEECTGAHMCACESVPPYVITAVPGVTPSPIVPVEPVSSFAGLASIRPGLT